MSTQELQRFRSITTGLVIISLNLAANTGILAAMALADTSSRSNSAPVHQTTCVAQAGTIADVRGF